MTDPMALLQTLGAPATLLRHATLVLEAAELLLSALRSLSCPLREDWVRAGAVLHDAGKILHPEELYQRGARHEPDGEALLLSHGVSPSIARCCRSHARWDEPGVCLEERLVALADKLWKGKRAHTLEERVVRDVHGRRGGHYWELFLLLDAQFETIAATGTQRLARV